jgi:hypothetical protein
MEGRGTPFGSELRGVDAFRDKIKIKFGGGNGYRDSKKFCFAEIGNRVGFLIWKNMVYNMNSLRG